MEENIKKFRGISILNGKPVKAVVQVAILAKHQVFDRDTRLRLKKLQKIYQKVPKTKCGRCGKCCCYFILTPVYSIEYLNILKYIRENFPANEIYALHAKSKMNLYAIQKNRKTGIRPRKWKRWLPCIFFDQKANLCRIYKQKPFLCRAYGLYFKHDLAYKKKKQVFACRWIKFLNKKDRKLLESNTQQSLRDEIEKLSKEYIHISNDQNNIVATKSRRMEEWFFIPPL